MICYQCIHNTEVYTAFQCFVIPLLYYTALYYNNTITKSTKKQSNVALQEMNKLFQVWDTQTILGVIFWGDLIQRKILPHLTPNVSTIKLALMM